MFLSHSDLSRTRIISWDGVLLFFTPSLEKAGVLVWFTWDGKGGFLGRDLVCINSLKQVGTPVERCTSERKQGNRQYACT